MKVVYTMKPILSVLCMLLNVLLLHTLTGTLGTSKQYDVLPVALHYNFSRDISHFLTHTKIVGTRFYIFLLITFLGTSLNYFCLSK